MTHIIEKAKQEFHKAMEAFGSDPYQLRSHLPQVEKWAKLLIKKHPEADKEVVMLGVWLHDIGHYPVPAEIDHAVRGEQRAKEFLQRENFPLEKMKDVLHCVRAHRCNDVMPASIESKIIAFADSASHMTDTIYFGMARDDKDRGHELRVYAKMERDFRDLDAFPEIQKELAELHEAWKRLIKAYDKLDL